MTSCKNCKYFTDDYKSFWCGYLDQKISNVLKCEHFELLKCCGTCYYSFYDKDKHLKCEILIKKGEFRTLEPEYGSGCSAYDKKEIEDDYFILS